MEYLLFALGGLLLGSYLNSWVWRVHEKKWHWGGRSQCIHCERQLSWYENIPLLSFIGLGGRCRTCSGKIPFDYFLVELATALLFLLVVTVSLNKSHFSPLELWRNIFFAALLVVIFLYDTKYGLIISGVVGAGAIVGLVVNYFFLAMPLSSLLIGVAVGGGFFLLQYLVSEGRWIGGGDVRLGFMMGLWLGWPGIVLALFFSYIFGALVALPLLLSGKKQGNSPLPLGAFLSVGTLVVLLWGNSIMAWYRALAGI